MNLFHRQLVFSFPLKIHRYMAEGIYNEQLVL